jgi:2'-5' RNA ligase
MRLFVAVDLSPEAVRAAERAIDELRDRSHGLHVRWVDSANLHITVRFIGYVADEQAGAVIEAVKQTIAVPPFDLRLEGCGAFPPSGPPRVLWIGVADGLRQLASIHHALNDRLAPLGYPPEDRPFSAHLTLARSGRDTRLPREIRQALAATRVDPTVTRVDAAVLYQSHLSPRGARYEAIARIPLDPKSQLD